MIAIIIVLVLIIIILGIIGYVFWSIQTEISSLNPFDKEPTPLGGSCSLHTDCANWGPGPTQAACCGGICTSKINGWCPNEGPNVAKPLGGSCSLNTDCANWGPGPTQAACCGGICTSKINGWCPNEGPNVAKPLGGSCVVPTDCANANLFVGSPGITCCSGTCQNKVKDWANQWYCPNECRGGPFLPMGSC